MVIARNLLNVILVKNEMGFEIESIFGTKRSAVNKKTVFSNKNYPRIISNRIHRRVYSR